MSEIKRVIIQKRIEEAMKDEFNKLLEENQDDALLKLLIENKIDGVSIDELKHMLE